MFKSDSTIDAKITNIIRTKNYRDLADLITKDFPINIYIGGETGIRKINGSDGYC
jgi:hypothetical protein